MFEDIDFLERTILNSIPSKQTILLDDWLIRLNDGYTYRADCVCPFHYGNTIDTKNKVNRKKDKYNEKIEDQVKDKGSNNDKDEANYRIDDNISNIIKDRIKECEAVLRRNNLPAVFKVTPDLQKGLDLLLEEDGYKKIKTVNAMVCDLNDDDLKMPQPQFIKTQNMPDNEWLETSGKLTGIAPDLKEIHFQGIKNIGIDSVFVSAVKDGKVVGCGYGTVQKNYVGIYDLHVNSDYRKQGIGNAICDAILSYGKSHNADQGYLIVHSLNDNAIKMYEHREFKKVYQYYFYEKSSTEFSIIDA